MAGVHSRQDTAGPAGPETAAAPARHAGFASALLGANLWFALGLWPLWFARPRPLGSIGLSMAPLVLLGFGVWLGRRASPATAPLLLFAFPVALTTVVALRAEELNDALFGPAPMTICSLSLIAYLIVAVIDCRRPGSYLPAVVTPLGDDPWEAPERRGIARRTWLVGAVAAAGFGMIVIVPTLEGLGGLDRAWGDAALEGGVLTAMFGAAVSVALLTAFTGSPRSRRHATGHDGGFRVALLLFLTLLGAVTYFVVT